MFTNWLLFLVYNVPDIVFVIYPQKQESAMNQHVLLSQAYGLILVTSRTKFSLHITNIIYSQEFTLNLIYVSKLCKYLHLVAKFTPDHYYLQNMKSIKMIGLTNQMNGLYKFMLDTRPSTPIQHTSLVSFSHKHVDTIHKFSFLSIIPYNSL